ncbi:hypothetical protein NDU88_004915 [Pleurodeles waltl]|uniref:Reverse transcriptase n=1 Tax=Pleurodeles waltl TaxID=8319 RepID=A0AAV7RJH1_PLEWA|nr:hypothetical protein NDU88_004915 [Pleurodeles waltl]
MRQGTPPPDRPEGVRHVLEGRVDTTGGARRGGEHVELDTSITTDEIHIALRQLARKKTPGMDGLPVEYYAMFAKQLSTPYLEVLREAQMRGVTQRLAKH